MTRAEKELDDLRIVVENLRHEKKHQRKEFVKFLRARGYWGKKFADEWEGK